jgi:hypothetical protein
MIYTPLLRLDAVVGIIQLVRTATLDGYAGGIGSSGPTLLSQIATTGANAPIRDITLIIPFINPKHDAINSIPFLLSGFEAA